MYVVSCFELFTVSICNGHWTSAVDTLPAWDQQSLSYLILATFV